MKITLSQKIYVLVLSVLLLLSLLGFLLFQNIFSRTFNQHYTQLHGAPLQLFSGFSLALILAMILVLTASLLLLAYLLKPVKDLTRAARAMADGNLDMPITIDSNDELAELGDAFSLMRDAIRQQFQQLHTREHLYRELVESTNSIILRWDAKGTVLFMNQYGLDLFGFTADELFGRKLMGTIIARADKSGRDLSSMIKDIVTHPKQYLLNKNENTCKDGSTLWIQWSNRPIIDEHGRFTEMLSVGIDVTSLELTRQQLEENELRFQALYQTSHDAILILQDGFFTCCNKQAEKLFNCSRDEIIGKTPLDFSSSEQPGGLDIKKIHLQNMERAMAGERVFFNWILQRKNGEQRETEVNLNSIKSGAMDYIQISVHDITERRKLEQELRQHQKMEAIGTLAGGIAHDFNNILTAIMGFTEIALHKTGPESPVIDELRQVHTASKRARDLVRQILTFSRKTPRAKVPIQFSLIVQEVTRLLRSSLPATIEMQQDLHSEAYVKADPTQLHQVVMNLCTNAFHAMEENGGLLTIALDDVDESEIDSKPREHCPSGYVRLRISDTGTGMAPEILNKIFDPYFTTKDKAKGSGMGLAVVHGIVESHGGIIEVDSALGEGTSFTVYLPVTGAACRLQKYEQDLTPEQSAAGSRQIMFVDDEATLRDLTSEFLVGQGYRVRSFIDGQKAWEAFKQEPQAWDLIITDQTMPGLTGTELIAQIRSTHSTIPILLCTGYSDTFNPDDQERLGISKLLQKPTSLHQLLKHIQQALSS